MALKHEFPSSPQSPDLFECHMEQKPESPHQVPAKQQHTNTKCSFQQGGQNLKNRIGNQ
jgi:hypothetical protein